MKILDTIAIVFLSLFPLMLIGQGAKEYQKEDSQIISIDSYTKDLFINREWVCHHIKVTDRTNTWSNNSNINIRFLLPDTIVQQGYVGNWSIENGNLVQIRMNDSAKDLLQNKLHGYYGILNINDSTLVLTKNSTTQEDMRYTYSFKNKELHESNKKIKNLQAELDWINFLDWCIENGIDFNSYPNGITELSSSNYYRKIVVKGGGAYGVYEMKTLDNGEKLYFRNNEEISKFDYEYDLKLTERHNKN